MYVCFLSGCDGTFATGSSGTAGSAPDTATAIVMDTVFDITVYGETPMASDLVDAGKELDEKVLSRYTDSVLRRYSQSDLSGQYGNDDSRADRSENEVAISGYSIDLKEIINRCDEINAVSDGAFDIRLGALSDLWNIDSAAKEESDFIKPSEEEIIEVLDNKSVPDLGSVGKGVYLDLAYGILSDSKAKGAVISAGGSILTYGEKPDGNAFRVGIKDPFNPLGSPYGILELSGNHFISTSGGYERYIEVYGERYHHILNPLTGYPAWSREDIRCRDTLGLGCDAEVSYSGDLLYPVSVTVIADNGLDSDALSTACFVLGVDKGLELANKYNAEIIFILSDGSCIYSDGILVTDNMNNVFKLI